MNQHYVYKIVKSTLFLILLLTTIVSNVSADNLVVMKIGNEEQITFINHTSNINGNWIKLTGGDVIKIPSLAFDYSGVSSLNYTAKNGKSVNIIGSTNKYVVDYPLTIHSMYANKSDVNAIFYNSPDFNDNIDIYLTKSSPTELKNIATSIRNGDTEPFRNLLKNSPIKDLNKPLNKITSFTVLNFGTLNPGDYVVIIMRNETNKKNLTIVSATTFQVLEHNLTAIAPISMKKNEITIDIPVTIDAPGNFTYVSVLIHEDSYKGTLKLMNNGTKSGINLSLDGVFLIENFNISAGKVNQTNIREKITNIIGVGNFSFNFKSNESNLSKVSLDALGLKTGRYILSIGAWSNKGGERLVGFSQKIIFVTPNITTPIDFTPPIINIIFPKDGSNLGVFNNSVIGSITDESAISIANITLNGKHVANLTKGNFSVKMSYIAGQANIIKVFAKDANGLSSNNIVIVNILSNSTTVIQNVTANKTITLNNTKNNTNTLVDINSSISANVTIHVNATTNASEFLAFNESSGNFSPVNPAASGYGLGKNQKSLNKYVSINVSGINKSELNSVNLTIYYTEEDLDTDGDGIPDLNENTLNPFWYNPNTGLWMPLSGNADYTSLGGPKVLDFERNISAKYVRVNLNHFSIYSLAADVTEAPSSTQPSTGGGSGGGGGGGVVTSEPYANIEASERDEKDLLANKPVTFIFKYDLKYLIDGIVITGTENEANIALRVETLKEVSKNVNKPAPGVVYKYLNIWIGTKRYSEGLIKFKVPNSWMTSNSISESNLKMLKWDGSEWVTVNTVVKSKDSEYTYFEATTPTFSSFAISGVSEKTMPSLEPSTITTPTTPKDTAVTTTTPSKEQPTEKSNAWIYAFVIVVIIATVAYLFYTGKIKEKK